MVRAIQVDSVETLPDIEPDDDKSIPSTESVFSCVKSTDNFMYPCIVSDVNHDMDIVEAPLARPQLILRGKGTMLKCVHDLLVRASKNFSLKESIKVKELLVELKETTFHDPEKPLTQTGTIVHEIPTIGRPVRIPSHRVATE